MVPFWPPYASRPKQQVELVQGKGLALTRFARVKTKTVVVFMADEEEFLVTSCLR
jgi:hypothetical protein